MLKRKVIWTYRATIQLNAAVEYIRKYSPQNSDKIKQKILEKVNELSNPEVVHRKDPLKKNNDGNYLYFEILKYRIVYYVQPNEVFIIRIRHASMEPEYY